MYRPMQFSRMNMNARRFRLFLLMALAITLAGCASGPIYRQAEQPGDYGYRDTMLSTTQFRVSFSGGFGVARETVENFALLRAAQVTLQHGSDRFQVTSRETSPITETSSFGPTTSFGYGWGYPYWGTGIGYSTGGVSRTRYETVLQIRIGQDVPEQGANIYDARQIKHNLAYLTAQRQL